MGGCTTFLAEGVFFYIIPGDNIFDITGNIGKYNMFYISNIRKLDGWCRNRTLQCKGMCAKVYRLSCRIAEKKKITMFHDEII